MSLRKSALTGVSAIALSVGLAYSAQATTMLPVTNLDFNQFDAGSSFTTPTTACGTGGGSAVCTPKDLFTAVKPTNWSIGTTTGLIDNLIYVGNQKSEGLTGPRTGANVYKVYTNPGFTDPQPNLPPGTNFFQADGNPQFESTITQTIHGLTAGTTYTLEFLQAAGQQVGFSGATTEQWLVYLGVGGIGVTCPTNGNCTVTGTANNQFAPSTLMNTPSMANHDWESVNLSFTPTASDLSNGNGILTFLAWGNNGSDINLPPTVFLEGVNTPPMPMPEPATLSLLGAGLLGLGGIAWRRRNKRSAAA